MTHSFPTRRSSDLGLPEIERRHSRTHLLDALPGGNQVGEQAPEQQAHRDQGCLVDPGPAMGQQEAGGDRDGRQQLEQQPPVRRELQLAAVSTPEPLRSEEHTSELQSLMRISYAVFCLTKKKNNNKMNPKK